MNERTIKRGSWTNKSKKGSGRGGKGEINVAAPIRARKIGEARCIPDISKQNGGRGRSSIALTSRSRPAVLPLRDPMTGDTWPLPLFGGAFV